VAAAAAEVPLVLQAWLLLHQKQHHLLLQLPGLLGLQVGSPLGAGNCPAVVGILPAAVGGILPAAVGGNLPAAVGDNHPEGVGSCPGLEGSTLPAAAEGSRMAAAAAVGGRGSAVVDNHPVQGGMHLEGGSPAGVGSHTAVGDSCPEAGSHLGEGGRLLEVPDHQQLVPRPAAVGDNPQAGPGHPCPYDPEMGMGLLLHCQAG